MIYVSLALSISALVVMALGATVYRKGHRWFLATTALFALALFTAILAIFA